MLTLKHGHTIEVDSRGTDELVEIRDPSGVVELQIRVTDDGIVLQLEAVRISLKAAESVDVECKTFNVGADESIQLHAAGDVVAQGKLIHLN
jgi:hypothetical protein